MPLSFHPSAFLIDLDGVVFVQERLLPGSVEAIEFLRQHKIPHRFVTNTTTHTRMQILDRLRKVGLTITMEQVFTAPLAAAQYLQSLKTSRVFFYTEEAIIDEFEGITRVEAHPTHIVIGDVGSRFSYEMMNRVFTMIQEGAEIVGLQKNRYWITREGLRLDAGAFIAALEYATGKEARIFGKPSLDFFKEAAGKYPVHTIAMIGDDLLADIEGAAKAGMKTIFVRTGKDKETSLDTLTSTPDLTLPSLALLPHSLTSINPP